MLSMATLQTIILACNITVPGLSFERLQDKQQSCRDRIITCIHGNSRNSAHTLEECLFSVPTSPYNQEQLDHQFCNPGKQ